MDLLQITILILSLGYISFLFIEKIYHNKIRKSFKHVILVNGIRGKSTTTRLIDAGLRNCGFKVFSKTTGTIPTMINVNNEQVKVKRLGLANIREQYRTMRKAYKEHAEILVIECMAVNPELQYINQHRMLNSDLTVITNVRMDHIGDMGNNLEELAEAMSNTIPSKGYLIVNGSKFNKIYKKKILGNSVEIYEVKEYQGSEMLDTFKDNIEIALGVCDVLNLDRDQYFEGMKKYHHDPGAFEQFKLNDTILLNGFSINDPESIKIVYKKICEKYNCNDISVLINVRNDRPTRTLQHLQMLKDIECKKFIFVGANKKYILNYVKKHNIQNIEFLKNIEDLQKESIVFGSGNIGGDGMKILNYFKENGVKYDS